MFTKNQRRVHLYFQHTILLYLGDRIKVLINNVLYTDEGNNNLHLNYNK